MTLSIERADRRMGLASDRTVYSSKRNRPLLLYGRLLDDSRPSHGLTATNPDYFLFADDPDPVVGSERVLTCYYFEPAMSAESMTISDRVLWTIAFNSACSSAGTANLSSVC